MKLTLSIALLALCLMTGCSKPKPTPQDITESFGWFDFAPPQGWRQLEMSSDGASIAFLPEMSVLNGKLEISNVSWMKGAESGKLSELVVNDLKSHWEYDKNEAEKAGKPVPPFSCEPVKPLLNLKEAKIDAYRIQLVRNGHELHFLKHIIELKEEKYMVEFVAKEPKFSEYLPSVEKSISSLTFLSAQAPKK